MTHVQLTWEVAKEPPRRGERPGLALGQPSSPEQQGWARAQVVVGGLVTKLYSYTLCDPMDCSLPGCSVHGIFQARILEWVPSNLGLPNYRWILYQMSHQGSPHEDRGFSVF